MRSASKRLLVWGTSAISFAAGAAMLVVAFQIEPIQALADSAPADCFYEGQTTCMSGQSCCNGTCYDPTQFVCTCDGTLESISYFEATP